MFLEWWMIGVMAAWWFVSIWSVRQSVFNDGVNAMMNKLIEDGYIEIDENDNIIGLCNSEKIKKTKRASKRP